MKALRMLEWGQPPDFVDIPVPMPGPGQVLVRVAGVGACHSDISIMETPPSGAGRAPVPFTLGHETAGWVEAVGPGVRRVSVADPVVVYISWGCGRCTRCIQGQDHWCPERGPLAGMGNDGGLAEYQLVPDDRYLIPLGGLDPHVAGPLADAGLTAYHAVRRALATASMPGQIALVIGAGGLGHMAIQFLRVLSDVQIIAVDTDPVKRQHATDVGAHAVADPADAEFVCRERSRGQGADIVLDFVGADSTLALAARSVATFGSLVIVGAARGTLHVSFATLPRDCNVSISGMGSIPDLHDVVALANRGAVTVTTTRYPLTDAPDVYRSLKDGTIVGRAVLNP